MAPLFRRYHVWRGESQEGKQTFHSSSFLFQPIFLNWSTPHFRVLSAHRPFQELKIIPEMTQDVLTKLLSLST